MELLEFSSKCHCSYDSLLLRYLFLWVQPCFCLFYYAVFYIGVMFCIILTRLVWLDFGAVMYHYSHLHNLKWLRTIQKVLYTYTRHVLISKCVLFGLTLKQKYIYTCFITTPWLILTMTNITSILINWYRTRLCLFSTNLGFIRVYVRHHFLFLFQSEF